MLFPIGQSLYVTTNVVLQVTNDNLPSIYKKLVSEMENSYINHEKFLKVKSY